MTAVARISGRILPRSQVSGRILRRAEARGRIISQFPARVLGRDGISIARANAVYSFSLDYTEFAEVATLDDFDTSQLLLAFWDADGETFRTIAADNFILAMIAGSTAITPTPVVGSGVFAVDPTDRYLRVSATGAIDLHLGDSAERDGLDLEIKDVLGNWATYNVTLTPFGVQTIDGLSTWPYGNMNYQSIKLRPNSAGYDVLHSG